MHFVREVCMYACLNYRCMYYTCYAESLKMIWYCIETIHTDIQKLGNQELSRRFFTLNWHIVWYNRTLNLHARDISPCNQTHITHRTPWHPLDRNTGVVNLRRQHEDGAHNSVTHTVRFIWPSITGTTNFYDRKISFLCWRSPQVRIRDII